MRYYKQIKSGFGKGDCLKTCIGCLMNINPRKIPNFSVKSAWYEDMGRWLMERGWGVVYCENVEDLWGCTAIAVGLSPRCDEEDGSKVGREKKLHCVIVDTSPGESYWVHDPHPSNAYLLDVRYFLVLVKREPK